MRVFALMTWRGRLIALVMFLGDYLNACNGVVCVTARSGSVSMLSVLDNRRAAWRRCPGSRRYAVMRAAAEDAMREDVQTGDDDDKLVHFNLGNKAPQLRLKCHSPSQ